MIVQTSIKIFISILCGSIIGYDRLKFGKPAGIKTHALVCLGSCIIMITGILTVESVGFGDPMRLGSQVVSGIGFIGAGAIIVDQGKIQGLTTAAGLWFAGCLGILIGSPIWWAIVPAMLGYFLITHGIGKMMEK